MNTTQKLAKNTIIQVISKIISTFFGVIAISLMTRYLGKDGFGAYTTIIAFLQFFGIVVDMGLTLITVQMISEPGANKNKIVSNLFSLRLVSAILFLGLAPLIVLFFPYSFDVKVGVAITTLSFFFIALNQIMVGLFQKHLRMDKVAIGEVAGRIVLVAGIAAAVLLNGGLWGVMLAVVLGSIINFFILFKHSRQYAKISWDFDPAVWKLILSRSWPIAISIIFNLIYLKTDIIILSLYHSQEDVGIYGAAYRVIDILTTFPYMFVGLVLPMLTFQWAKNNKKEFQSLIQLSFNIFAILAFPLVVGTIFLANPIMILIAGSEFEASGEVLKILILGCGAVFVANIFAHAVIAINEQKKMIWGYLITAALSLSGYFIFIPKYSYQGAAWVTVFSESFIMVIVILYVIYKAKISLKLITVYKTIISTATMGTLLYFIQSYNLLLQITLAIAVYFAVLFAVKGISKNTIKELLRVNKD